jgi:hypothetical protein
MNESLQAVVNVSLRRRLHTVAQIAAEFAGVTRPTIYRYIAKLPATADNEGKGGQAGAGGSGLSLIQHSSRNALSRQARPSAETVKRVRP